MQSLRKRLRDNSVISVNYMKSLLKVKSMQRARTEAIRTLNQPSKLKREITKITNSVITKKNIWSTEGAAISQKVATQQPKPN